MTKDNQRFVAHVDVLGMRTLVSANPELAWDLLSKLVEARNASQSISLTLLDSAKTVAIPEQIRAVTFSDTVLLFSKGETTEDLMSILVVTTRLFSKALNLNVPIRAGIAVGTFYYNFNESMFAGPALIQAYDLGEAAKWIGITVSEEVFERAKLAGISSGSSEAVVQTRVPVCKGYMEGYAVNWPRVLATSITESPPLTATRIYQGFSQYFGPYEKLSNSAQAKYENTAQFFNERGT